MVKNTHLITEERLTT